MTLRLLVIRPPFAAGIRSVYSVQEKGVEKSYPVALRSQCQLKIHQTGRFQSFRAHSSVVRLP